MEQFNQKIDSLTAHFEKVPGLAMVCEKSGVKAGYVVLGTLVVACLLVVIGLGTSTVINVVGILYPAYMSFKAIESMETDDDKQWLTYWLVFAFYSFLDRFIDYLFFWVPGYFVIKLVILIYMFFPETRGASRFYEMFARPMFKKYEEKIDGFLNSISERIDIKKSD